MHGNRNRVPQIYPLPNAIANGDKVELVWIKIQLVPIGRLNQLVRQPIVVLFLLQRVVLAGVSQIILAMIDQKVLQLHQ